MGGDDAGSGQSPSQLLGHGRFVLRVSERKETADGDCLRIDLRYGLEIERTQDAVRPDALVDAEAAVEGHERLRMVVAQPVEMSSRLPPQVEEMLEPGGRDERCLRALALQKRVGRDRRPVREALHVACADGSSGREHRLLLASRCRNLRRRDAAILDQNGVRERAADIDAENAHAAKADSYERTVSTRYPLELGLAVSVPRKNERKRQRPIVGGLNESRATPSEPVRRFTRLEKTQPSSGRKRSM